MFSLTDAFFLGEDMLLGVVEIFFVLRFYRHVYGKIKNNSKKLYWQAGLIMLFVSILLKISLPVGRPDSIPPVTVVCSFLFLVKYPSNRKKRILFSTILLATSSLVTVLGDLILTPLQLSYFAILLVHVVFWMLLELIIRIGKYAESQIPYSLWILLLAIALSSIATLGIMWYFTVSRDNPYQLTTEIPTMSILLFINISLFVFFDRFSVLLQQIKEKAILEQQLEMQSKHYRELEATHRQLYGIQHDMKNYLRTASHLAIRQGKNEELVAFLDKVSGQLYEIEQVVSTGNENLDSVLNIKITELNRNNICVNIETQVPPGIKFSFEQSVTILGNLLDNAKEACLELPQEARWVFIKIQFTNHVLFIKIKNSANEVTQWKDRLPISTKRTHGVHGIGLRNVKEMIGDTGTISVESLLHSFQVRIVLYDM